MAVSPEELAQFHEDLADNRRDVAALTPWRTPDESLLPVRPPLDVQALIATTRQEIAAARKRATLEGQASTDAPATSRQPHPGLIAARAALRKSQS